MFGWIGGLCRCSVGRHERSEAHVHKVGEHYISKCRYCGVRMRRLAKRNWIVERLPRNHARGVADHA